MKSSSNQNQTSRAGNLTALTIAVLLLAGSQLARADLAANNLKNPRVTPPGATPYGQTYGEWSAAWWTWALELPVEGPPVHPFIDDPSFDVTEGQSGPVWFLAAPFGTVTRTCTVPTGKSLFVALLNAEASDLEGLGSTAEEQRATAAFFADHIVGLSASIDGVAVGNLSAYRCVSPQFNFVAPTPWIEGATGGSGTSVADGYFLFLNPLSKGSHVIKFSGGFHFSVAEGDPFDFDASLDMTYNLMVK